MAHSNTIEDYLKAIFHLSSGDGAKVSTKALAEYLEIKAPTVTDMLGKLTEKKFIKYEKYYGVELTKKGRAIAINIIRKHRIWEVFLHDKLQFSWDEVHDIAEQLEHIESVKLTDKLDKYLDYPKHDPHGDPIPTTEGVLPKHTSSLKLHELKAGESALIIGVDDSSSEFLKYLKQQNLGLGTGILLLEKFDFDASGSVQVNKEQKIHLTEFAMKNITVEKIS